MNNKYFADWSGWTESLDMKTAELPEQGLLWDLNQPRYDGSPKTPDWARITIPDWIRPFQGKNGMPHWEPAYREPASTCGDNVVGLDLYHANHFIVYRPEVADYIYSAYTPPDAKYIPGTLPRFERMAARYTSAEMSQTEKLTALLTCALPAEIPHPATPPYGKQVPGNRGLSDDDLLASGSAWCNEQARVLIRLCQTIGIQGRMIHLLNPKKHTTAEVFVDGRWVLVDVSWYFLSRDEKGNLLSAAESYDRGPGQRGWALSRQQALAKIVEMNATQANLDQETWETRRKQWIEEGSDAETEALATSRQAYFGVVNIPVPHADI